MELEPYGTGNVLSELFLGVGCSALSITFVSVLPIKVVGMGIKNAWEKSAVFTPVSNYVYSPENPNLYAFQDSTGWKWHFE